MKTKAEQLSKTATLLDVEFIKSVKEVEFKSDMSLVVKANVLKRRSEECFDERKKLQEALGLMEEKREKL